MTLRASLMRQLANPILSRNQRAEFGCEAARRLEDVGDYAGARAALAEFWPAPGERPCLDGLCQSAAAELLLRAGALTGWLGHSAQAGGAQEAAKNLITEAARLFGSAGDTLKVWEAQTELAYCYWRAGEYDEARVLLREVLARLTADGELRAKAVLRSAIVERSATRYADALRILTDSAGVF